ncbi:polyprenyl synthetase family protein [Burkholderia oklahomensis]|uniref:polyprenyl synthetase family protein n=1 Tax=Burkholderia oklahomensis TaxID=342113 RepID=UPI00016A6868|nr:polyprenyl synthetase family protein [Burkholderia oklahomensis]AJX32802.1 polyprenyl synthetase family protein [Burkholderia oklahomensis C6786]AOI44064.1 octaprenyl diphosphate synthase [Burkholderia oklahomensis EO147]AOI47606.1 octaprenyl diphosphate synthase [Burkholderia oklahomensis C6786]KUY64043.1 octaprenyl diphosphate synthase [Burkholderia oklahomensis EO147]KUY65526.1 octaprenyl diphosphate synthase [Burkholderia oklahomensis C6786]
MSSTATPSLSAAHLLAPIASDMEQVNRVIRQSLASDVLLINQIAEYIIGAGGKRLRPALLLLVAGALGENTSQKHVLAAVVEFIHTATLLHDDVVDESELRRGRKTANALFGNAASVLVGDYLYSRSFEMMVGVGKMRVMEILSEATTIISEGEVLQLLNMHDADVDETRYMQVIRYKTAKLFEASARLGAVLAGADAPTEAAAAEYGRRIGTAFQIMDDWLDYAGTAASMGKNAGDDLREGKPTLPLIYLIERGTPEQSALAREAIEQGGTDRFDTIFDAITRSGALDHTLECARQEAQAAAAAISSFPSSIFKESLLELCSYSTSRQS